ncbi:hypothetical protein [Hyphomonas sp.]|nr:hypothetical protein [Hyphomonas sp.]
MVGPSRKRAYIEHRVSETGVNEFFNGWLRDECLKVELFNNLTEAKIVI